MRHTSCYSIGGEAFPPQARARGPGDRTTTFTTKDTFCVGGTIIKDVQLTVKYYDTVAKKLVEAGGAPPSTLKAGGFVGSSSMPVPAGKWELKVYVGDKLVAVLPFEVK